MLILVGGRYILNKIELIDLLKTLKNVSIDNPFSRGNHIVARHKQNQKWFALIVEINGRLAVNLKCDPIKSDFLRRVNKAIIPAWHMNKVHWNTVFVNNIDLNELKELIEYSYELTK